METKYSFRKRLESVHIPINKSHTKQNKTEIAINDSWEIIILKNAGMILETVALDLKDYFKVAMNINIDVKKVIAEIHRNRVDSVNKIIIGTSDKFPSRDVKTVREANECGVYCDMRNIYVYGKDEKNAARGCYALEKMLNLRKGPYLKSFDLVLENRFSPRMIHSGWELDTYPENYLRKIAHSGFDSILIYYRRKDAVLQDRIDEINELINKAANYGIGVYLYIHAWRDYDTMHPSEPGAEKYYESFYGKAFKNHPDAAGCILVGESCAFPSRDPETNGGHNSNDNSKPHPGWWPCIDYPEWLSLVKKVILKYKTNPDIVFWTYNWGWAPENKRLELIENLPSGISLLVTFEMFEVLSKGEINEICADYTIKFEGPGQYFISEAKAAKEKKLKLYAMSNTGGKTWDFGVIPYIPVPFQWIKRWEKLLEANKKWNLSGLMESHHYGWAPSYISKLGEYFSTHHKTNNPNEFLFDLVKSDFGMLSAKRLMKAWKLWSDSIAMLPATAYDQYGPLRVGPSYPFYFNEENVLNIPSDPDAYYGNKIIAPMYSPESFFTRRKSSTPIEILVEHEISSVKKLKEIWQQGVDELTAGMAEVRNDGKAEYVRILALGEFVQHTLRTLLNIKLWWQFKRKIKKTSQQDKQNILDKMALIAKDEIENAKETIKIIEKDSRLGWEPTMGYMTDKSRLLWKIEQLESVLRNEILNSESVKKHKLR